ncbi:sensor histidine kinase KdpD [Pelomonas sp. KK5]|uniref:sensor histidine kinase n=1 Tax=Pelomonas sp. KK5 TaxID=1855730 RepID=UPI00097BB0C0|nr:ATP-binding protein [Pelomonas sp. KK5]
MSAVDADEARLELLITCLLDNACKYTPPGGTVTIEVKGEPDRSVLRIKDTGAGFAADVAKSMFDAFTQGQRTIERSQGALGSDWPSLSGWPCFMKVPSQSLATDPGMERSLPSRSRPPRHRCPKSLRCA